MSVNAPQADMTEFSPPASGDWVVRGPTISGAQFDFFRKLALQSAGISIPDFKRSMVHRRILKRLMALNINSFDDYIILLNDERGATEIEFFVNALTTNKTSFFRESHHFDHLAKVAIPEFQASALTTGKRQLRIWSAGCSSGPEPYSIAITLADHLPQLSSWDAKILATDIDTEIVQRASIGIYSPAEIEDVDSLTRRRHFSDLENGHWGVANELRKLVVFNQLNLHGEWPMQKKFDAIFCRNVIIYFDKPAQRLLFDKFADVMKQDAFLYIGHSESLFRVTDRFEPIGQNIYRKVA
ncbi:MAG: protein-glutamate O-methyltransferase CheR [Pseudomonadota bacterium]|nr:protein-glutamate O-methyltransferase CheR [Pseudomonadota bacterium]